MYISLVENARKDNCLSCVNLICICKDCKGAKERENGCICAYHNEPSYKRFCYERS